MGWPAWSGAIGGVVAVAVVGGVVGYAVATPSGATSDGTTTFADAVPIPASPALPVEQASYTPDPDYPALATDLTYDDQTFTAAGGIWHYQVPHGWIGRRSFGANHTPQVTWKPPGETAPGGYQLRIAPVEGHSTPGQMVSAKNTGLQESQTAGGLSELVQVKTSDDAAWYTFRDTSGRLRLDDFAWVTPDGSRYAGFELSVSGRQRDQAGLDALLSHVHDTAYRTTTTPP